jgi:hypothetical protein
MCMVLVEKTSQNADFIMYNYVLSKTRFTLDQLIKDLKKYDLDLSDADIKRKVWDLVSSRVIRESFNNYSYV